MIKCKHEDKIDDIIRLHSEGFGHGKIGKELNIPKTNVKYLCKKYNLENQQVTKKYMRLNDFQKSAILGMLLGDSSISDRYNMNIGHGDKQKDYFDHKVTLFYPFFVHIYRRERYDERTKKVYTSHQAYSNVYEELKEYRNLFYKNGKKVITQEILEDFNEISLGYFFMDDGNFQPSNTTLALCSFSEEEIKLFRMYIFSKWNIETTMTKQKSVKIRQKSIKTFESIIKPYIIESMLYKLSSL